MGATEKRMLPEYLEVISPLQPYARPAKTPAADFRSLSSSADHRCNSRHQNANPAARHVAAR
jgi:hypothetical protein